MQDYTFIRVIFSCHYTYSTLILYLDMRIGNHMNSSAIWEIIALSHAFEEM